MAYNIYLEKFEALFQISKWNISQMHDFPYFWKIDLVERQSMFKVMLRSMIFGQDAVSFIMEFFPEENGLDVTKVFF